MPSVTAAIEYLKELERKGRGSAPVHIVDIEEEAKQRAKNDGPKPKTRFQLETDSPDMYRGMNEEKDRIIKHAQNKSVGISLIYLALKHLTNADIDRILAQADGPDYVT